MTGSAAPEADLGPMADVGLILAGSSAPPGSGGSGEGPSPCRQSLWSTSPHRGSNKIPNSIALPQALLCHRRVSSACRGGGGQAWPLVSGQQGEGQLAAEI